MNSSEIDHRFSWEDAVESVRKNPDQTLARQCYYDDPLSQAAIRFSKSEEWSEVLRLVNKTPPAKVLDVGAGRGIGSYAFAKSGFAVTALEPDPSDVVGAGAITSLAQATSTTIKICQQWGESLPFEDESFDIIYGRAVFHHARDLVEFSNEVHRVLRKDGTLLLTREHVLSKDSDLEDFLNFHDLHHLYGGECAYRLDQYVEALNQAGFKSIRSIGPHSSAINFYPMTDAQQRQQFRDRICGRLRFAPPWIVNQLLKSEPILRRLRYFSDLNDESAGRLYSFLGSKR